MVLGESLLAIKLFNCDVIFGYYIHFLSEEKSAVERMAKPRAVPPRTRVSTFATAKSNNSSNYISLEVQKFLPVWKYESLCLTGSGNFSIGNHMDLSAIWE